MIPILKYNEQGELKQVDEIAKRDLYKGVHSRKAENDEERFVGTCTNIYGDILEDAYSYILVPYDDTYREFVINHTEQYDDVIDFEADASYFEFLKKSKPREPQKLEKVTLQEAMNFCLQGTRFKPGNIEYAGTATVNWVDYNSPYDILKIICTAFNVQFESRIEVDNTSVINRYIDVRIKGALFNGKEIVRGKDLISLKRTVDKSEIVTALYAIGPDPEEGKQRVTTFVTDDNAQERWGEPDGSYRWDVYSPETENNSMSLSRLTTLAKTALNKRINAAVSYDIEQYDLEYYYPHEKVRFGDLVRIKDVEFKPPLYAEAEVIEVERDIIDLSQTKYVVGSIKEFKESDLLQRFGFLWVSIKRKLADNINNVGTIVNQVIADELQYVEKKIFKSQTEPDNPVDGMYWFDTSNERVGVLKKRVDGQWVNVSEEERNTMGGLSREVALYRSLIATFENLAIQHQKLYQEVTEIMNSPYLISDQLRNTVNDNLNALIGVYNNIKSRLDSINEDTATIGFLIDTQALFQDYRARLLTLDKSVQTAKVSIDERLKILQQQYTDEKFKNAMKQVADTFGIQQDEQGRFIGPPETVAHMIDALKTETQEEMSTLLKRVEYETDKEGIVGRLNAADSERIQLSNEIKDRVTITEYNTGMEEKTNEINTAVNNIKIGGVNMLDGTKDFTSPFNTPNIQKYGEVINGELTSVDYDSVNNRLMWATFIHNIPVQPNTDYTISYDAKTKDGITQGVAYTPITRLQDDGSTFTPQQYVATTQTYKNTTNEFQRYSFTFNTGASKRIRLTFTSKDVNSLTNIKKVKLEIGNKATPYEQSPNDISNAITKARSDAEVSAKAYADAQDKLRKTEAQAYADGIVDAEEQRAINDAQQKLAEAKADAQAKADTAESLAKQHADTQSTLAEQSAKAYADGLKQQTDQTLTTYDSRITQNGQQIELKASKDEYNKTRGTLDKTLAQIINSHTGISLSYDDNGHVSDIIIDPQGIALNSNLITINNGDVTIQNGTTTIKSLVADKIQGGILSNYDKTIQWDLSKRALSFYDQSVTNYYDRGAIQFNRGASAVNILSTVDSGGNIVLNIGGNSTGNTDPNSGGYVGLSIYSKANAVRYVGSRHIFTQGGGANGTVGFMVDNSNFTTSAPSIMLKPYWEGGTLPNYYVGYNDAPITGVYTKQIYGLGQINNNIKFWNINNGAGFAITNGNGWGIMCTNGVYSYNATTQKAYSNLNNLTKM